MLKKFLAIVTVLTVMFTLVPAVLQVSAATDPEGTIIVYNDTATEDDSRFIPYNTPTGGTVQTVGTHGASKAYEESKLTGYNGRKAVQLLSTGYGAYYKLTAENNTSLAGSYDIYIWNVCEGNDDRRGSATHPDYHAQYSVVSANGETKYFIDQKNASGGKDGWVKLGTHYFSGGSGERVVVSKNYQNNSSTYMSAVKFVPVNKPSSAKLTHMYMKYDNSTRIETEDTPISSNTIVKQFPSQYADASKRISLTFEAEDPDATVEFSWGGEKQGAALTSFYADPAVATHYNVIVTSEDGTATETYKVALGVDSSNNIKFYSVGDENFSSAYNGTGNTENSASNSNWKYPSDLTGIKSNLQNLGDVNTWTIPSADITPGYYSVYVWSMAQEGLMDETVEVIVNHSGLRETKAVTVGNYHLKNAQWAYAGSYYFDGSGNENVSAMKVSETNRLAMGGIKLAPCVPTRMVNDFEGITVSTGSETVSMTKEMITGVEYVQPLAKGDYTTVNVKVIGNHPQYEYVKLNGNTITTNTGVNIPVNVAGETSVTLEIKLSGQETQIYKLLLFKANGPNMYTQRVGGTVSNLKLPVSTTFSTATGEDAKYIASEGAVAGFKIKSGNVDIITDSFYKILVWKPAFNYHINSSDTSTKLYASANQPMKINTGNKTINKVIDWTGADSEWVDLGNYLLNHDAIGDGYAVEFTGVADAYTMLNEVKYLKLSDGILVDNEFLTLKEIDDNVIYTGGTSINVTPYIAGEPTVYINGALATEDATNIELTDELNRVKVRVEKSTGIKEYNFAVVKSASIINWDDENVNITNDSATGDGTTGYKGTAAAVMFDDSAVYSVSGLANGETNIFVYGIPVADATLEELGATGNYSVSVTAGGTTSTTDVSAPTNEGWIEIGTYNFTGSGNENVTITVDDSNIMYLNCIKLESAIGELCVTAPVIETSDIELSLPADGNTSAWVYAYNKTGANEEVTVLIAAYNKTTKQLVAPVAIKNLPVEDNVIKISTSSISVSDSENVYVKAFVWNGMSNLKPLKPANEIGVENN